MLPTASTCTHVFPSGYLPAPPQSWFASPAPLPSFTNFQLSILVLSLKARWLPNPSRSLVTWSFQSFLSFSCANFPISSHKIVCRRYSGDLCSLTLPRSASLLRGTMLMCNSVSVCLLWLPVYTNTCVMLTTTDQHVQHFRRKFQLGH